MDVALMHYQPYFTMLPYWDMTGVPSSLELTTPYDPDRADMQCVDPGEPYTAGGTVIFECRRVESESGR